MVRDMLRNRSYLLYLHHTKPLVCMFIQYIWGRNIEWCWNNLCNHPSSYSLHFWLCTVVPNNYILINYKSLEVGNKINGDLSGRMPHLQSLCKICYVIFLPVCFGSSLKLQSWKSQIPVYNYPLYSWKVLNQHQKFLRHNAWLEVRTPNGCWLTKICQGTKGQTREESSPKFRN